MKKSKKLQKRKRPLPKNKFEFTVVAKDSDCEEIIKHKANAYGLKFYQKGHARHRLYFKCKQEKWKNFLSKVKHLCLDDGPGLCPAWLQKSMLKNLHAIIRINIEPTRTKIAQNLLATTKRKTVKHSPQAHAATKKTNTLTTIDKSLPETAPNLRLRIGRFSGYLFKKCLNHIQSLKLWKKHLQPAHN